MPLSEEERFYQYTKCLQDTIQIPLDRLRGDAWCLYQYPTKLPNQHKNVIKSLLNHARVADGSYFLCAPGDNIGNFQHPVLCKSGPVADPDATTMCVIIKLNAIRHWAPVTQVENQDRPFEAKRSEVLWRGSSTGWCRRPSQLYRSNRKDLVEKFGGSKQNGIDVGVVNWCQGVAPIAETKQRLSLQEQLKYKYIIAAEGNDVATNLKWILASNSVPMMPEPTMRSWCLEDLLEPYVHYVPLKSDFSDLVEQYEWCKDHDAECEQIAKNGKEWMSQFMDEEVEDRLQSRIIAKYFERVKFCEKQ